MSASATKNEGSQLDGLTSAEIEILRARAERYAKQPEKRAEDVTHAIVLTRGGARYAAPLRSLREIRPLKVFCRIPDASRCVPGMFHCRGEILSLHDIEAFMMEGAGGRPAPWVLILEQGRERIGLMADEVLDVVEVSAARVMPVPITFGDRATCFEGILDGGVFLLAPPKLFSTPSFFSAFPA